VKEIHIRLLKEYLDEIIVNNGVLYVANPEQVIEKVRVDYLVKLAFQFYRKLYAGEVRSPYMNRWEWFRCHACTQQCPEYLSGLHDPARPHPFPARCPLGHDDEAELVCLHCGARYPGARPADDGYTMPVCPACQEEIGQELEIWQRLFGNG